MVVAEQDMNGKRSTPVLLLGFGLLIGLIAVTGIGALQRARKQSCVPPPQGGDI